MHLEIFFRGDGGLKGRTGLMSAMIPFPGGEHGFLPNLLSGRKRDPLHQGL